MPPPVQAPPATGFERGDERVAPVVEVEERALGTLEEDVLAPGEGGLDEPGRVVEVALEAPAPVERTLDEGLDRHRLEAHGPEEEVLVREDAPDALGEHRPIEEVLHPQPDPPGPVAVGRPDAAAGRADLRPAEAGLVAPVEGDVVRHDHVGAAADLDLRDVDAPGGQHVQLGDERRRVDDHAVADDRRDVRIEHARRHEVELEDLVAGDHGMAGVVAALVADDHRDLLGEEVGGLALALISPLQPDDDGCRHQRAPRSRAMRRCRAARLAHARLSALARLLARRLRLARRERDRLPEHRIKRPRAFARGRGCKSPATLVRHAGGADAAGRSDASRDGRCALLARSLDLPARAAAVVPETGRV